MWCDRSPVVDSSNGRVTFEGLDVGDPVSGFRTQIRAASALLSAVCSPLCVPRTLAVAFTALVLAALTACGDPTNVQPAATDISSGTSPTRMSPSAELPPIESPSFTSSSAVATPSKRTQQSLDPDLASAGLTRSDLLALRRYMVGIGYYDYTAAYLGEANDVPTWDELQQAVGTYLLNCEAVAKGTIAWEDQIDLDTDEVGVPRDVARQHWYYVRDEVCSKVS